MRSLEKIKLYFAKFSTVAARSEGSRIFHISLHTILLKIGPLKKEKKNILGHALDGSQC